MTAGWQVLCFLTAFVLFLLASAAAPSPRVSRWWPTLAALGLAAWVLVSLWNANAAYD